MQLPFTANPHERQLIPDGRFTGPMPWVMAIMLFLSLLAAAAALALAHSANQGSMALSRQATVQILENDPDARIAQQRAVAASLRKRQDVHSVNIVPESEARALLEPWLGEVAEESEVPVPALIDVEFKRVPDADQLAAIRRALASTAPSIRIDGNAQWLKPWFELVRSLLLVALAILLLLLFATGATVALAVRGALNTHKATIEIIHMMGGTDVQVARLFQRRVALDALFGSALGLALAISVILLLGERVTALEPGLLSGASVPLYGWPLLLLIPLAVTALSMAMARWTVLSTLKKML
ncbi:MAG TPA: cell division protein [Sphingorhabdus sp.]|nr:cell division protein [Sphingorhabdus sp.]